MIPLLPFRESSSTSGGRLPLLPLTTFLRDLMALATWSVALLTGVIVTLALTVVLFSHAAHAQDEVSPDGSVSTTVNASETAEGTVVLEATGDLPEEALSETTTSTVPTYPDGEDTAAGETSALYTVPSDTPAAEQYGATPLVLADTGGPALTLVAGVALGLTALSSLLVFGRRSAADPSTAYPEEADDDFMPRF